jgi:iron-sulfur cluster repair protein YtfE (RIC family)
MKRYLNKRIKEIVKEIPGLTSILKKYDISCATCTSGNCFLKDIFEEHNLSMKEEMELVSRISKIISGEEQKKEIAN